MADETPTFKRNDTHTPLVRQLLRSIDGGPEEGVDFDAEGVDVIRLIMASKTENVTTTVTQAAVPIADPRPGKDENGWTMVTWDADDLAVDGIYDAEHQITYADDTIETIPNDGYFAIRVVKDLG